MTIDPPTSWVFTGIETGMVILPASTPGTCCDHDPFGGCLDEQTAAECNCDKCEFSPNRRCDEIECLHNPIPTVSEWGLVVLTLLLLTGAKVYFGRRTQAVASG